MHACNEWEDYSNYFREEVGISRIGLPSTLWSLMVGFGTVMVPIVVLFSLLIC